MKLENIDPSVLQPNPWNSNVVSPENEEKLEKSLDRLGMFKPLLVRTLDDGSLQILGGEHRAEASVNSGAKEVPIINLGVIDDQKAKEISLVDNGRYGSDDTLKLAELLDDLGGVDIVASFTPFSNDELDAVFSASSIDLDDLSLDDEDEPALPEDLPSGPSIQTHQIMRFKVPVEDADLITELVDHVMKTQGLNSADALTNAGDALVHMAGDFRQKLLEEEK